MEEKYALITGASSGIGKEIAKQLAKMGYNEIIVARRVKRLDKMKEELEKEYGIKVIVKECDLAKEEECINLYKEYQKYNINVLINNAGFGKVGDFAEIPLDLELEMIRTNVIAMHILTKLFVKDKNKGYILNVASMAGFQPGPKMSTYGATKAYVLNFSNAVQYELKKSKNDISITTLCPGPVDTEFNHVADAEFHVHSISAKLCSELALKGLFKKKAVVIPSINMRTLRFMSRFAPLRLIVAIEYHFQSNKVKKNKN